MFKLKQIGLLVCLNFRKPLHVVWESKSLLGLSKILNLILHSYLDFSFLTHRLQYEVDPFFKH